MQGGNGAACLESAVRVASLGVLDKGAETREAGTALMLTLAQVGMLSSVFPLHESPFILALMSGDGLNGMRYKTQKWRPDCLQVYGRAPMRSAIAHLSGGAKDAASKAFEKVASSKSGMAALQAPGAASEGGQTSPVSQSACAGSRPTSRGATTAPVRLPHSSASQLSHTLQSVVKNVSKGMLPVLKNRMHSAGCKPKAEEGFGPGGASRGTRSWSWSWVPGTEHQKGGTGTEVQGQGGQV